MTNKNMTDDELIEQAVINAKNMAEESVSKWHNGVADGGTFPPEFQRVLAEWEDGKVFIGCCFGTPRMFDVEGVVDCILPTQGMKRWKILNKKIKTRREIITDMCFTWRHDFGLIKEESSISGMSREERDSLWNRMAQIFDNCIANHICFK